MVNGFMGLVPQLLSEYGKEMTFGESELVTPARLYAFRSTAVTCFSDNVIGKADRY